MKLALPRGAGQHFRAMRTSWRPKVEAPGPGLSRCRIIGCALLLVWPAVVFPATFTATLDRGTVAVGEAATLTLSFEGGEPKTIPVPPPIDNLQIESQGSSRNLSIINNQISSTISHTFAVIPMQPGEYTIPALPAEVGGQALTSQPLKLVAQRGEKLAFFKLVLPRREVYVGEVFPVELQVHIRDGVANADNILQNFDEFNGCPLKAEGFSILRTAHGRRGQTQIEGSVYRVTTLVTALSALKTGTLTISSIDVKFTLQLPVNQGRSSFFQQYQARQVAVAAEPETVSVLDLPKENIPPSFNGAVGRYSLSVTAGPTNVVAGDPVTVRIRIAGQGGFDALVLPEQPAWRDFKTVPPITKVDLSDALGLQGAKTFEQVVFPQSADIQALPPVSFSFFDPEQKKYQVIGCPATPLVVRPAPAAQASTVMTGTRSTRDTTPAPDIVHIKQRMGTVAGISPPLVLQPWFLALQGIPIFIWAGALVWRRRIEQLANNPRLRRRRLVAQIAREGVTTLRRHAAGKDSEAFFVTLFRLLQEQLGERLDLPASSITEVVIEEHLRPRGAPERILTGVHELFQICNLARYAPIKSSQELEAIIPKFEALSAELRNVNL